MKDSCVPVRVSRVSALEAILWLGGWDGVGDDLGWIGAGLSCTADIKWQLRTSIFNENKQGSGQDGPGS